MIKENIMEHSENEIVDKKENTTVDNKEERGTISDDANYSIYNYFKSHPTSAIAVFSGVVAIITFLAEMMAYIINKNILDYWGFDVSYASLGNESLLYTTVTSVVYGMMLSFSVFFVLKNSDVYIERKRYYLTNKYLIKKQFKLQKDSLKRVVRLEKTSDKDREDLYELKESILDTLKGTKSISKSIRKQKNVALLVFIKNMLPIVVFSFVLAFILSLLLTHNIDFWISVLFVFSIQILTFFLLYFLECRSLLKKKEIKSSVSGSDVKEALEKVKVKKEYPLSTLGLKTKGIRNSTFFTLTIYVIVMCVVFVSSFTFSATQIESRRKEFQIINLNNEEYIVAYRDKDTYFLEKATMDDKKLIVYINHQRIISGSDFSFSIRKFDEVIRDDSEVLK